jgi:MoaA/NifB/PqqE/SkfB family radical SAM enzyme
MRLGLVITAQCNAACLHCSKSYGPNRTEALSQAEIIRLMDEAAAIDDGQPLCFDITGGEPFLQFDRLVTIVAHGASLGAEMTCMTNAFWARNDEIATRKLTVLKECGLRSIGVSASRFHEEFVSLHRVERALRIAMQLGITTELKLAVTTQDLRPRGRASRWKGQISADWINMFPVLPHLRDEEVLPEDEYYREVGLPPHKCPGDAVCVDFNGIARSCCSLGTENTFLKVGDIRQTPLKNIHRIFQEAGKQKILREDGPIGFARGAIVAGLGHLLRKAYAGPCDLCLHIRTDSQLRRVAEEMSFAVKPCATEGIVGSHR